MSAVTGVTPSRPAAEQAAAMCSPWVREFDIAVTRQPGYRSAMKSESDPQPQPRSRTRMPSSRPARSQVSASMASSAAARSSTPSGHRQQLYLSRGPRNSWKKAVGSS